MPDTHQPQLTLIDHLKELPDPRVNRTRHHELTDILVISICTLLCGGESFYDMEDFGKAKQDWFATFLPLPNGIPRQSGQIQVKENQPVGVFQAHEKLFG